MGPVSIGVEVQRNTDGDTPSKYSRPLASTRPSLIIFKDHLLRNRFAIQSQISRRASQGSGNESFYKCSRSHDQDARHAHIWYHRGHVTYTNLHKLSFPLPGGFT